MKQVLVNPYSEHSLNVDRGKTVGHRRSTAIEGRGSQRSCREEMMIFYFVCPKTTIEVSGVMKYL